jgi:hypothetical protein
MGRVSLVNSPSGLGVGIGFGKGGVLILGPGDVLIEEGIFVEAT